MTVDRCGARTGVSMMIDPRYSLLASAACTAHSSYPCQCGSCRWTPNPPQPADQQQHPRRVAGAVSSSGTVGSVGFGGGRAGLQVFTAEGCAGCGGGASPSGVCSVGRVVV